ncbi:hypothetical protein BJ170DRAFT_642841 [Xylariales sp. AK1849]|nr:hypothetical protein BJ170DRAFT_642841 [Xylariales sp. AK1849]
MLPDALASVYRQYKLDTDFIAAWLASTARAHGYNIESPPGETLPKGRLKGKARREAKKAAAAPKPATKEHIIAIKNFIPLAKHIVACQDPVIVVPKSLVAALTSVTKVRHEFGELLREHGHDLKVESDLSHKYFITVLEVVFTILEPRMTTAQSPPVNTPSDDHDDNFANGFSALSLEEPSQTFLDAPDITHPEKPGVVPTRYIAESQTSRADALFALRTVMKDVKSIRQYIWQIWKQDFGSEAPPHGLLATDTILTSTGIDLGNNIINEASDLWEKHGGYQVLLKELHKCEWNKARANAQSKDVVDLPDADRDAGSCPLDGDGSVGMLALPLCLLEYLDAIVQLDNPTVESIGMPCFKDSDGNEFAELSDADAAKAGVLATLMAEMRWEAACKSNNYWPVQDELMRGMREMIKTRKISFHLLLSAQVLFDIMDALGDNFWSPYNCMIRELGAMRDDVEQQLNFIPSLMISDFNHNYVVEMLRKIQVALDRVASDDPYWIFKFVLGREFRHPVLIKPHSLYKTTPVLCGLVLNFFRTELYKIGLHFAKRGVIVAAIHLNNALGHEQLVREKWSDETVIEHALTKQNLYVGDAPTEMTAYYRRYCIRMGMSIVELGNSRSRDHHQIRPRRMQRLAPVSTIFSHRYVTDRGQSGWTPQDVDAVLNHSQHKCIHLDGESSRMTTRMTAQEMGNREREQRRHRQKQEHVTLTPTKLLVSLNEALQNELLEHAASRLTMHRAASEALRRVKAACTQHLRDAHGIEFALNEDNPMFMVAHILAAMGNPSRGEDQQKVVDAAAEAMTEFITSDSGNRVSSALYATYGLQIKANASTDTAMEWTDFVVCRDAIPEPKDVESERWLRWWGTGKYSV